MKLFQSHLLECATPGAWPYVELFQMWFELLADIASTGAGMGAIIV